MIMSATLLPQPPRMTQTITTLATPPPTRTKKAKTGSEISVIGDCEQAEEAPGAHLPSRTLADLPVELIYDILIISHSSSLPLISRRIRAIASSAPPSIRARYILSSHSCAGASKWVFAHALHFPLCTLEVFTALERIWAEEDEAKGMKPVVDFDSALWLLPKRLFRDLPTCSSASSVPASTTDPYPLVSHLFTRYPFNADSHGGYPLAMAVRAPHIPLIQLLLERRAHPDLKNGMAVRIAIAKRDLSLVRMLIERTEDEKAKTSPHKRRKLEDRIEVTGSMLQLAVKLDAKDIVAYLMERGCVPDMKTLKMVR